MNEKEVTRLACIRAVNTTFENVQDDDHALFIFETMGEYPDDQVLSAIDVNGAKVHWLFQNDTLPAFAEQLSYRVQREAESVHLNLLVNSL